VQDEREIRAIIDCMFDAWGRGDAAAYHADLTDDADDVAFEDSRRGRVGPLCHPRCGRGAPDRLGVEGWRQQMRRCRLSRQTMVVVRRDGRWQVTAFHNPGAALSTSGPMVELGRRFVRWRTNRARRKQR
jgi:plasmid stabilization system protein ParE